MTPIMILKRALQIYAIILLCVAIVILIEGGNGYGFSLYESLYFWVDAFANWLYDNYRSDIPIVIYLAILLIGWGYVLLSAIYDIAKHYGWFAQNETSYIEKLKFYYQKAIVELHPNVYRFIIAICLLALVIKLY